MCFVFIFYMGFLFFGKKEDKHEKKWKDLHEKLDNSFTNIKKDAINFSKWINHLHNKKEEHHGRIERLEQNIYKIEGMLEELSKKQVFLEQSKQLFKHKQPNSRLKQLAVGVQTPVQTGVQTANLPDLKEISIVLKNLTVMERAVVWVLLNTDLKMSYEDISVTLGKDKSTVRGQLNNIKRKSESLISESTEYSTGKKRYFIHDEIKNELLRDIREAQIAVQTGVQTRKKRRNESL